MHRTLDLIHHYAPNALVGLHARSWATGADVAGPNFPAGQSVDVVAQRTASFLTAAGGPQLDLLVTDWKTDDAGSGHSPWWDNANLTAPTFNRILHWQNRMAFYSGYRLLVWKMPAGNMNLTNRSECVNGVAVYQDNRIDYAFTHGRDLIDAGLNGVIIGGGYCDTNPSMDGGNIMAKAAAYYATPLTPVGFTASVVNSHGSIQASWSPNSDMNLWGYRVYYGRSATTTPAYFDARRQTTFQALLPDGGQWYVAVAAYSVTGKVGASSSPISLVVGQPYQVYLPLLER